MTVTCLVSSRNGPDWKSKIKYIPDPENPNYPAAEIFENNWHAMRPYPCKYVSSFWRRTIISFMLPL